MSDRRATAIIVGPDGHGVVRHAELVAGAMGCGVVRRRAPDRDVELDPDGAVHVHFTEALFGATTEAAGDAFLAMAAGFGDRVVVSVHDVPECDGSSRSRRRRATFRRIAERARMIIVSSEHERQRLRAAVADRPIEVIPLPIVNRAVPPRPRRERTVGIAGFVYPGKGHDLVVASARGWPDDVAILAGGATAPGHDELATELIATAAVAGRCFAVTGTLDDDAMDVFLASVTVPVVPARQPSASMSLHTWIGAGRRPLVVDSAYARELAGRAPAHLDVVGAESLGTEVARRLEDPSRTWHRLPIPAALTLEAVADAHWAVLTR